jgi:glycosyltransferase involved in cell wall biosynthesis
VSSAPADVATIAETLKSRCAESAPTLRVLTLTPFHPSVEDGTQGCFVAEPLIWTQRMDIENEVIAVASFYRRGVHANGSEVPSRWARYFSLPGNLGLPTAGTFLAIGLMASVRKAHSSRPFDLIHAHAALPCGHAAALLSRRLGIPFVVSVHGLDVFSAKQAGGALGKWCRSASERVYRKTRVAICISEKVRERVAEQADVNTTVVYNGVDPAIFSPGPESPSPLAVLSVGNLIPIKGHAALLRAFARVTTLVPDSVLEIIGDGIERQELNRLAEGLGIGDRVLFLGRQSREAVAAAMRRCAIFALPSRYEGLGCVYLEAMAAGKPAIGCRGQGIDEIIEHGKNGFLISPGSEMELSEALGMLLQNGALRRRIGIAGRDTVLQRHTLEHQARQLTQIYRECVA